MDQNHGGYHEVHEQGSYQDNQEGTQQHQNHWLCQTCHILAIEEQSWS